MSHYLIVLVCNTLPVIGRTITSSEKGVPSSTVETGSMPQLTASSTDGNSRKYVGTQNVLPSTELPELETKLYNSTENYIPLAQYNTADLTLLPEYKIYYIFSKYLIYLTTVPGLITNPITIYISLKSVPFTPSELHMLVLGFTDLFVVSIRTLLHCLKLMEFVWTDATCKWIYYFTNVSYLFSNWILVSWTLERFIAVFFPMKLNVWCTLPVIKRVLCVCCLISFLVLIPQITEGTSLLNGNSYLCTYSVFYFRIYSHIENLLYIYLPMILITGCNTIIIIKLYRATKKRTEYTTNQQILEKRAKEQKQLTLVLVTVASVFVLLHATQVLARIWQAIYPDPRVILKNSPRDFLLFNLFLFVGYSTTDFQNSINFFLYCAFGSKVRKTLRKNLCCQRVEKKYSSTYMERKTDTTTM